MKRTPKTIIRKLIIVGSLALTAVVLSLLKLIPYVSEYVFSRGISRAYAYVVSAITKHLPFSLYEVLLTALILTAVVLILKWVFLISKRRDFYFFKSVLNTLIVVLTLFCVYTATAGLAYYREPLPIPQYSGEVLDGAEFEQMMLYYLEDFRYVSDMVKRDENGLVKQPFDFNGLNQKLKEEYNRLGTFDGYLSSFTPPVKNIFFSTFMSYQRISGIAVAYTGEANINRHIPANNKVLTMAHELAHIKGVMNENEANMLSYYLTITSSDIYIRYAGYMRTMPRLMSAAYYTVDKETYNRLYDLYPQEAMEELNAEYSFWAKYDSVIDKVSSFFNDIYLKFSGDPRGVESYRDIGQVDKQVDPESGEIEYAIIEYSPLQKLYIQLYCDAL